MSARVVATTHELPVFIPWPRDLITWRTDPRESTHIDHQVRPQLFGQEILDPSYLEYDPEKDGWTPESSVLSPASVGDIL